MLLRRRLLLGSSLRLEISLRCTIHASVRLLLRLTICSVLLRVVLWGLSVSSLWLTVLRGLTVGLTITARTHIMLLLLLLLHVCLLLLESSLLLLLLCSSLLSCNGCALRLLLRLILQSLIECGIDTDGLEREWECGHRVLFTLELFTFGVKDTIQQYGTVRIIRSCDATQIVECAAQLSLRCEHRRVLSILHRESLGGSGLLQIGRMSEHSDLLNRGVE